MATSFRGYQAIQSLRSITHPETSQRALTYFLYETDPLKSEIERATSTVEFANWGIHTGGSKREAEYGQGYEGARGASRFKTLWGNGPIFASERDGGAGRVKDMEMRDSETLPTSEITYANASPSTTIVNVPPRRKSTTKDQYNSGPRSEQPKQQPLPQSPTARRGPRRQPTDSRVYNALAGISVSKPPYRSTLSTAESTFWDECQWIKISGHTYNAGGPTRWRASS
ncbi:hypothetical protein HK102_002706 [Quaeritorhiza haematococci]|nr:hypothetical protein HK102_002706 [Quaeritorhiza haematococci]